MPRSEKFYIEFITLTVLSLLAANMWIRFAMRFLDRHSSSPAIDLSVAIVTTVIAFLLMKTFFTRKPKEGILEEPTYNEELFEHAEKEE